MTATLNGNAPFAVTADHRHNGTTLRTWLMGLPVGTLVKFDGDLMAGQYIWTGKFHSERTLLVNSGRFEVLPLGELDRTDTSFSIVFEDDGATPRQVNKSLLGMATAFVDTWASLQDQIAWSDKARADWDLLNENLNDESKNRGWCDVYDRCVEDWNSGFKVFELQPRTSTREVNITVTATWNLNIEIEDTTDDEDAERKLNDLLNSVDLEDVLHRGGDSPRTPDDWNFEIDGIEVQ